MTNCKICGTSFEPDKFHPHSFLCGKKSCKCKHAAIKNKAYKAAWAHSNKELLALKSKEWCLRNPEKRKESSDKYRKSNKHYYAQYRSAYRYRLKQATPIWSNLEDIICVYQEADYFQLEVDHIIPLKHPLVCGLHVWNNLQLLSRSDNARKSNKFDIDILAKVE